MSSLITPKEEAKKYVEEYSALRDEIVAWIEVEYALIGGSAALVAAALAFSNWKGHWSYFSSGLLLVLSCLITISSFARAKIMLTSAYLVVYYGEVGRLEEWIDRFNKALSKKHIANQWTHKLGLGLLNSGLRAAAILYPLAVADNKTLSSKWQWIAVGIGIVVYVVSCLVWYSSYDKDAYLQKWREIKSIGTLYIAIEKNIDEKPTFQAYMGGKRFTGEEAKALLEQLLKEELVFQK